MPKFSQSVLHIYSFYFINGDWFSSLINALFNYFITLHLPALQLTYYIYYNYFLLQIQQLVDMGFTEERVRRALLMSHNDLNNATNFLLQESLWRATVDYQCATDLNQRQMFTKNILVKSCNCFVWEGWRYLKVTYAPDQ